MAKREWKDKRGSILLQVTGTDRRAKCVMITEDATFSNDKKMNFDEARDYVERIFNLYVLGALDGLITRRGGGNETW